MGARSPRVPACAAVLCAVLGCHPPPAPPRLERVPPGPVVATEALPALRLRLPSGTRVLLRERHLARVVALQAWVEAGAADEPESAPGVAHACQHLIAAALSRGGAPLGVRATAWTTADHAVYQLLLPSRSLGEGLRLLGQVLAAPPLDEATLAQERPALLESLRQAELSPQRAVVRALLEAAFSRHPYRRPVAGPAQAVARLGPATLRDFHRRRYGADRTTLVIVGDLRPAEAEAAVRRALAPLPRAAEAAPRRVGEPAQQGLRVAALFHDSDDGREAQLLLGFRGPGARSPDVAALDLAAVLLGHGEEGRLSVELRRNRQAASHVYAHGYTPRDAGLLLVGASLPLAQLAEGARAAIGEALRLAREEVTPEELRRARTLLEADAARRQETAEGLARRLGFFESSAGGIEQEPRYWRAVEEMTPRRLREVLQRYLRPEVLTIAVLQPKPAPGPPAPGGPGVVPRPRRGRRAQVLLEALSPRDPAQAERLLRGLVAQVSRPSVPAPAAVGPGALVEHRLRGGGRLLLLQDRGASLMALHAAWPGGVRAEDERSAGASHLLSQLLCRGTRSRSAEQVTREFASLGGEVYGSADEHVLGVGVEVLAAGWERALALLADCLKNPSLPEEELERARRQALTRLHEAEANPAELALRLFLRALYPRHPYRLDPLGTPASVASLSRRRLLDLYRRLYPLDRLTLVVVGDAAPAQLVQRAEALLEPGSDAAPELPPPPQDPPPQEPQQLFRHSATQQAHLVLGFQGTTLAAAERPALTVLRALLGGAEGGRLGALRTRRGLYRAEVQALDGVEPGYLALRLACAPEGMEAAQAALKDELRRLVDHPPAEEELTRAKALLLSTSEAALQRRAELAAAIGRAAALGLSWDAHRRTADAILAVGAADVQRAARRFFDEQRTLLAAVVPERPARATVGPGRRQEARRR